MKVDLVLPQDHPYLILANHRSHLDVFILLSRISGIRILAKDALFRVPFLGLMLRSMGHIKIMRHQPSSYLATLESLSNHLEDFRPVLGFPEMTRCPPGFRGVQRMDRSLFRFAYHYSLPVLPVVLKGTDHAWPKGKLAISFKYPIRVQSLRLVHPSDHPSIESFSTTIIQQMQKCSVEDFT